jgi:hypothetical protein
MAGSVNAFIQSVVNDLLRGAMSDKAWRHASFLYCMSRISIKAGYMELTSATCGL